MAIHLVTGHGGTPHVTAADYGSFNASLVGTGAYIMDIGEKFGIEVISNNSVRVKSGDMLFQGRHIRITGYEDLTVDNGTQGENRNDLIVLRYERNTATGVETAALRIAKGTAASSPADPTITTGDIIGGDAVAEVALYRLPITGIILGSPVLLISEIGNFSGKADGVHTHTKDKITDFPTSMPANGGNAATVGGKLPSEFATYTVADKNLNNMAPDPTGFYKGTFTGLPTSMGDGQGTLQFINYGAGTSGWCTQIFYSAHGFAPIIRRFTNGTVLEDWQRLSDGGNASTINGSNISIQIAVPSTANTNDLWIW